MSPVATTDADSSANTDQDNSKQRQDTPVPVSHMFSGRSVFITGASGFIGRCLLEKLLRSYGDVIERIYILMRVKKNRQPADRLHKQLLNVPIFDGIRAKPNGAELLAKIVVVPGDIAQPELGIGRENLQMMLEDPTLSIVFHSAATIKFDEPLKISVNLNLIATRSILSLCRRLPNLISLCHVSTAYVNSDIQDNQWIEEKVYPISEEPKALIAMGEHLDEHMMQELKVKLVKKRPNTYTYTKALAEKLICDEAKDLPVCIVRPSIVGASWKDPLPGWVDNLNGPTGLILAIGKGLIRSMVARRDVTADIVPVDIVVNTMIASAYHAAKINDKLVAPTAAATATLVNGVTTADLKHTQLAAASCDDTKVNGLCSGGLDEMSAEMKSQETSPAPQIRTNSISQTATTTTTTTTTPHQTTQTTNGTVNESDNDHSNKMMRVEKNPPIVHCNTGELNPITWGYLEDTLWPTIRHYPSCQVLRWSNGTFKSNRYHDLIARLFAHYLPALILDLICMVAGRKRQLLSTYVKLHGATGALEHFCTTNYRFQTKNMKIVQSSLPAADQSDLYMDMEKLQWLKYWDSYVLGARRYVLREQDDTLDEARKSFKRAYYFEIILRVLLVLLVGFCLAPFALRYTNAGYSIRQPLNSLRV